MLHPFDIPNPTPPAGQRREDATLSFSRRVKIAVKRIRAWHDSIERACDQVFVDMCLIALWAGIVGVFGVVILEAFGVDVVSYLPGRW
jgi:hypothetical protein